jgi:hypothetical protein
MEREIAGAHPMPLRWRPRYKISWLMVGVGAASLGLSLLSSPNDPVPVAIGLILLGPYLVLSAYLALVVLPYYIALRRQSCPACGRRKLASGRPALACSTLVIFRPPLATYWRCRRCGTRLKKAFLGFWRDASEEADDRWYAAGWLDGTEDTLGPDVIASARSAVGQAGS